MAADEDNDRFSDDPEEQLRIENEILKLKLQAELGSGMDALPGIPPEVENIFLRQVLSFAHMQEQAETVSVYDLIGAPDFKKHNTLTDGQLSEELNRIEELMARHNVVVSYAGAYPPRDKYYFLTEELFPEQILDMKMPDMVLHFVYEDFHPDHRQCIDDLTAAFIQSWLDRNVAGQLDGMAASLTDPGGRVYDRTAVFCRVQLMFDSFIRFEDAEYDFSVIRSDPDTGGRAEGDIRYTAVLENGETMPVEGTFRIDLQYKKPDGWEICFFQWPGFEMD